MSGLRAAAAFFCLLAIPAIATAGDWREHVPEGWLATLEVRDVEAFDTAKNKLPQNEAWQLGLASVLEFAFGPMADRPVALILIEPKQPGDDPRFLLFVPSADFDAFCEKLNAERVEGLAVFEFFTELAAQPAGDWVAITKLETVDLLTAAKAAPSRRCVESNSVVTLSPAGLDFLWRRATEEAKRKRPRRTNGDWPTNPSEVLNHLKQQVPVLQALAGLEQPIAIGLSSADPEQLRLTIEWDLPLALSSEPVAAPSIGDEIATLAYAGRISPAALELLLATGRSSAISLVESAEFPDEPWNRYAEASRSLLKRFESPIMLLTAPGEEEPIAANQSVSFTWDGATSELGEAILEVVTQWNRMMRATKTRSPMNAVVAPLPDDGGWRIRLDVFGLGDRPPRPEEQKILRQYYGHDHGAQLDIVPLDDGRWLATFAGEANRPRFDPGPAEAEAFAAGQLRVDRWIAWERLQRVAAQGRERDAAKPVKEVPPGSFRVVTKNGRTVLEAALPWDVLRLAMP